MAYSSPRITRFRWYNSEGLLIGLIRAVKTLLIGENPRCSSRAHRHFFLSSWSAGASSENNKPSAEQIQLTTVYCHMGWSLTSSGSGRQGFVFFHHTVRVKHEDKIMMTSWWERNEKDADTQTLFRAVNCCRSSNGAWTYGMQELRAGKFY